MATLPVSVPSIQIQWVKMSSLYEELNYCLDVREFHLLIWILFFKHLIEMKMCVWILFWVVKKVQCLLHEFVKLYITFFSFMFFLRLWRVFFFSQVFMFTVLSFLILNKLNFEYFYEYFSESKYKNLFTLICDNIRQSTLNHFCPQKDIYFKHLHNK